MLRAIVAGIAVATLSVATLAASPSSAAANAARFGIVCASRVGFSSIDRDACAASVFGETGAGADEPRDQPIDLHTVLASALAGRVLAARVEMPLTPLDTDPCDAWLSVGGFGCGGEPAAAGSGALGVEAIHLNEGLTDEQEALLGCGPFWGTDCENDGIDLTNLESSVLLQSFPGISGELILPTGVRGPGDPGYDPHVDGCAAPSPDPACDGAAARVVPLDGGDAFTSEMAALSWNFVMMLVAMSQPAPGEPLGDEHFDPDDPYGTDGPRCSFATPQYCSSVQAFFEAPEPEGALLGAAACGALALMARRSRRA